jgi:hypothetical protein
MPTLVDKQLKQYNLFYTAHLLLLYCDISSKGVIIAKIKKGAKTKQKASYLIIYALCCLVVLTTSINSLASIN